MHGATPTYLSSAVVYLRVTFSNYVHNNNHIVIIDFSLHELIEELKKTWKAPDHQSHIRRQTFVIKTVMGF